jgi:hypothetical protein
MGACASKSDAVVDVEPGSGTGKVGQQNLRVEGGRQHHPMLLLRNRVITAARSAWSARRACASLHDGARQ